MKRKPLSTAGDDFNDEPKERERGFSKAIDRKIVPQFEYSKPLLVCRYTYIVSHLSQIRTRPNISLRLLFQCPAGCGGGFLDPPRSLCSSSSSSRKREREACFQSS